MANQISSIQQPLNHPLPKESSSAWSETANKITTFLTRIEGMLLVFSVLAGVTIAIAWGILPGLIIGCAGIALSTMITLCRSPETSQVAGSQSTGPTDLQPLAFATQEDLEARIRELSEFQIEALAKSVVAKIMDRFEIDILGPRKVEGEFYPDISGKLHPVIMTKYDPSSRFMKILSPLVKHQIQESFLNPHEFLENGLRFPVYHSRQDNGIVNQIAEEYGRNKITAAANKFINAFNLNEINLEIILKLNVTHTQNISKLYFPMDTLANGAKIGNTGFTIAGCESNLHHSTV